METPRLPSFQGRRNCGRGDLGGKQTCGPEGKRMLQPRHTSPRLKSLRGIDAKRRPGPNAGKAEVLWEETGECTAGAAGVGVQARRERSAEITSGRSLSQPGLETTGKDPSTKARSRRRREGLGLAHGSVVAKRGG